MSRLTEKFNELSKKKKKALVSFVSACDPDYECSEKIINMLPSQGVDIIEIGLPFSDPMADGPVIQRSSQRAIKSGFTVKKLFNIVKNFRSNDTKTPIILMGYFNTIFQYGLEKFFLSAAKSGVDGLIIVDLPPEEELLIEEYKNNTEISIIRLLTPTTDKKRLNRIVKSASGFLYYVSIMGITGTKKPTIQKVKSSVNIIKKTTKLPIVVGFGINNPKQIKQISEFADGTVVGSSLVKFIEDFVKKKYKEDKMFEKIKIFLKKLNDSCYVEL